MKKLLTLQVPEDLQDNADLVAKADQAEALFVKVQAEQAELDELARQYQQKAQELKRKAYKLADLYEECCATIDQAAPGARQKAVEGQLGELPTDTLSDLEDATLRQRVAQEQAEEELAAAQQQIKKDFSEFMSAEAARMVFGVSPGGVLGALGGAMGLPNAFSSLRDLSSAGQSSSRPGLNRPLNRKERRSRK